MSGFTRVAVRFLVLVWTLGMAAATASAQSQPAYQHYFGNTHSHTSYSDGGGTPADHYRLAKQYGYHFYAITDHSQYAAVPANYGETKKQADAYTDSTFVGIYGFEFSENDGPGGTGHLNALNTATTLSAAGSTVNLPYFYDWLVNQTNTVAATFNHPSATTYNSFGYLTDARRERVTMLEYFNGGSPHYPAFLAALEKGWRVSPVLGLDNHGLPPSGGGRTGVLATSLTRENILQAMRARRTYATLDKNLRLTFKVNGQIMGSVLYGPTSLNMEVAVSDPDTGVAGDKITKLEVLGNNGALMASKTFDAHSVTWYPAFGSVTQKYYFARVYTAGKTDGPTACSAPVWIDTSTNPAPAAPSGLSAAAASASQVNLTWRDNSTNETGFKIERKTGSGGTYAQIATVGANVTSYQDTGLSAMTTYYYRVRAYNSGGNSAYSNEDGATTEAPAGTGTGLLGQYFDNSNFTSPKFSRTDATINFDWGTGSPDSSIGPDTFAARWSGSIEADFSETYTITTASDDGVRLWIDGKLLIDNWTNHSVTENSATVALTAGKKTPIRIDYYENTGGATLKLYWSSASRSREIVPQERLYPWANGDVGAVGAAGSTSSWIGPSFTVKGSGADIWGTADEFQYVHRLITGDCEIRARVTSLQDTNPWAKAGVMIRETLGAGSRHAMTALIPQNGAAFQRRTTAGGTSLHTPGGAVKAPYWVRLVRQGANFTGYVSSDGSNWTWVGTAVINMGSLAHVGLAVTSHADGTLCSAQFDNVSTSLVASTAGDLVRIVDVSTDQPYSLAAAKVGGLPYIDRGLSITSLSPGLNGGVLVRTAMDDKYVSDAAHLTLELGREAVVYVCYDPRGVAPAWLSDGTWAFVGESLVTTDNAASPMRVYAKTVSAGLLTLGGNHEGGDTGARANYLVIVQPSSGSPSFAAGPVPADRWQHDGDADGDGLSDEFERANGLDPGKVDSDGDGLSDESEPSSDGRTMGDVQAGMPGYSGPSSGDDGGGGRCGSLGLDLMLPLAALAALRRRRVGRSPSGRL